MRKILSLLTIAMLLVFVSCEKLNESPVFDDSNAFVSFDKAALSISEDGGTLNIPVTLASLNGMSATVAFTIIEGTAKKDTVFTLANTSATLTFDATNRTQNIVLNIIDNPGVFTGDLKLTIQISDAGTIKPSAENICTITITDLDHPLAAILGTWNASGTDVWGAARAWELVFTKDAEDVSIVWIDNLVVQGTTELVYGVVNAEKTQIRIPVYQIIYKSTSYPLIRLEGYYGPSGDVSIPQGGYITVDISADNSTMNILDLFGSHVWTDAAGTTPAGWFNLLDTGVVLTR